MCKLMLSIRVTQILDVKLFSLIFSLTDERLLAQMGRQERRRCLRRMQNSTGPRHFLDDCHNRLQLPRVCGATYFRVLSRLSM